MTHNIFLFTLEYHRNLLTIFLFRNLGLLFGTIGKPSSKSLEISKRTIKANGCVAMQLDLCSWDHGRQLQQPQTEEIASRNWRDAQRLSACSTNTWSRVLVPNTVLRPQHLMAWWREHPSHINTQKEVIHLKIIIKLFLKKKSEQLDLRKSSKTTSRSHEQTGILRGPPIIVNPSFLFMIGRSDNLTNLV